MDYLEDMVFMQIKVPEATRRKLKAAAAMHGISMSEMIVKMVEDYNRPEIPYVAGTKEDMDRAFKEVENR